MAQLSRALRRWDALGVAAAVAGISFLAFVAAFVFAAASVEPAVESIIAAALLVGIAVCGFLYAWRDSGR